jgi:hypothetical protein
MQSQQYIGAPNGVVLCIDRIKEYQFSGRIYHAYSAEGIPFGNVDELIFKMEAFFDSINFPHPTTNPRTFLGGKESTSKELGKERLMTDEELLRQHGDLGNFIIRVQHRQNSSWQGRITWVDQNKTVYFRSIWEMVKLVENALDTVSQPEDGPSEVSWISEK